MTEELYLSYLRSIYRKSDGSFLSERTVQHYGLEAMKLINNYVIKHSAVLGVSSLYDVNDISQLRRIKDRLMSDPDFKKTDAVGHGMYSSGLNRYMEFAEGDMFIGQVDGLCKLDKAEPFISDSVEAVRESTQRMITTQRRDRIKVIHVEKACNYTCQIDPAHNTFIVDRTNHQYMEGHHIIPLSMQGEFKNSLDCYANIIVLCPTCHRFFHYAAKNERNEKLRKLYDERAERLSNSGIILDRKDFLEIVDQRPSGIIYS